MAICKMKHNFVFRCERLIQPKMPIPMFALNVTPPMKRKLGPMANEGVYMKSQGQISDFSYDVNDV